nr:putative capsid [Marmot picobirnavirus]
MAKKRNDRRFNVKNGAGSGKQIRRAENIVDTADAMADDRKQRKGNAKSKAPRGAQVSTGNHGEWWNQYPELFDSVTNFGFALPLGQTISYGRPNSTDNFTFAEDTVPGVCRIDFMPGPGVSGDNFAPINTALIDLMTRMKNKQRITGNFDWADMGMYMLAIDSLRMWCKQAARIYGIAKNMPRLNYYYPYTLLEALECPFDSIDQEFSDMRAFINQAINQVNRYKIPSGFQFYERHAWMCEGLFVDGTEEQAQTYIFNPSRLYVFDNTVETGSQLVATTLTEASWPAMKAQFKQMIHALAGDEDTGFISGAFMSAFDGQLEPDLPEIPEDYQILPVYNEDVLMQIENADLVGSIVGNTFNVTQDPSVNSGALLYQPQVTQGSSTGAAYGDTRWWNFKKMLSFHKSKPEQMDYMKASRFKATAINAGSIVDNSAVRISSCGTELLLAAVLYTGPAGIDADANPPSTSVVFTNVFSDRNTYNPNSLTTQSLADLSNSKAYFTTFLSQLAAFDWHPKVWSITGNITNPEAALDDMVIREEVHSPAFDVANWAFISDEQLEQLNYVALTSAFKPNVG